MKIEFARRSLVAFLGLGLFTLGLAACGESAEEREARRQAESTRALMRGIFGAMEVVLPASVEPAEYRDPANREKIGAALEALADNAGALEQHTGGGAARSYLARSIARDARDVERAYAAGQYGRSAFLVQQITENCIGCHTRLPDREDSLVATAFVDETLFASLPAEPRATLQMATRRFDDARITLEELIASDEHPALLLNALSDYLVLNLRVKGDFARPVPVLEAFATRDDAWPTLRRAARGWAEVLPELAPIAAAEPSLAAARRILDDGKALSPVQRDHMPLVHWVAASSVLERCIERGDGETTEIAEAHYLLGLIEARIGRQYWVTPAPYLLETAIRLDPGAAFSEDAYAILETELLAAWEGTDFEELPPEDEARLRELRGLMEAAGQQ
jgi:mono/diheme cytochrome c family protein